MQGRKDIEPKILYNVNLDDLVPKDNFYRKLNAALNLHFIYAATAKYYGSEGNESIDPVVFFKIVLAGYLNNINSNRQLVQYCSNCLDLRLFLKYDIDEDLPWHSTISRTRQLYGEEVFLMLFKKVLSLCIEAGMVRGKRQAVDSALVKANASMDSLLEKPVLNEVESEILNDAEKYARELNENSEYKVEEKTTGEKKHKDKSAPAVTIRKKKEVELHHQWKSEAYRGQPSNVNSKQTDEHGNLVRPKFLSNHTHFSPTDPDARIAVKPGKARQMNYSAQIAVDDTHHVITGALADFADKRDSQSLAEIAGQTIENLREENITVEQITADTGYSSGEVLRHCEENNIDAYIPNFGQYKNAREGFIYNKEKDQYECIRGNKAILPFKKIRKSHDSYEMKTYRSSETVCKNCPLRKVCIGEKTFFKKIEHSIDKPLYDKMHKKMQTTYARQIMRKRSSTVEPVLGTLINFTNMKRINTRGIVQANKHIMMAALTYNLKKYLRFISFKAASKVCALREKIPVFAKTLISGFISFVFPHQNFSPIFPELQILRCY